jgi:type IV pilus assembly protein PilM
MAREKFCVGLDIGTSGVKLCLLRRKKEQIILDTYGYVPLPPSTIVDGALMNPSRIIDAIKELLATHKIRHKEVAFAVSGHYVIIKKISLPEMTRAELESSITWEAEQFIPFDIADVNIDVQVLQEQSAQQGQMDVVLVAAKKDFIDEYTSVVTEAGLEPMVCDVDAFAIENMFLQNYDPSPTETVALVNVGASKTNINIMARGQSTFTRDLSVGGNNFTEEIQKQLGVSAEEAEALKLGGRAESGAASDAVVPQEVQRSLQVVSDNVATELQRSLDFYAATSADSQPSQIYLMGGSAQLHVLEQTIKSRVGVPVTVVDPFRRINTDALDPNYIATHAATASVAVGLALRYPGDN